MRNPGFCNWCGSAVPGEVVDGIEYFPCLCKECLEDEEEEAQRDAEEWDRQNRSDMLSMLEE